MGCAGPKWVICVEKKEKSIALGVETLEQNKRKENKTEPNKAEWPCFLRPGVCEIAEQFTEMLNLQGQIDQSQKEGIPSIMAQAAVPSSS